MYVGIGLSKADHGPARRCASDEIAGITGFGGDFDLRSEAHGSKPLPATIEEALSIIPASMLPTIVVATGNGVHAWWLFKEPYIFDTEEDRKDVARLVARWHTMLRLNAAARGWAYDRLSDLARILRIPGTQNHKDPAHPKDVTVHSTTDRRYNLSDFEEILDAANIPDLEAEEKAAREWAERFADKPLVIDLNARIPQELLQRWMDGSAVGEQTAMKFRNTWLRLRHDLKDQSKSGYDMALADFGVDAGLTEQQIVDLIIHHRAHHGRAQREAPGVFPTDHCKGELPDRRHRLTASGAARARGGVCGARSHAWQSRNAARDRLRHATGRVRCAGGGSGGFTGSSRLRRKSAVDRADFPRLGVPIQRLIKIDGKEPQYRMELCDGRKIEFANVGKLIAQDSVRIAIAATVGKIIPKIKAKHWEQISQAMLDACIIEEGTEEMEWEGAARMYLQHYLVGDGLHPVHRRAAGPGPEEADGAEWADLDLRFGLPDVRQQDNFPEPVRQGGHGDAVSIGRQDGESAVRGAEDSRTRAGGCCPSQEFDPDEYNQQGHEGGPPMSSTEQPGNGHARGDRPAGPRGHVGVPDLRPARAQAKRPT